MAKNLKFLNFRLVPKPIKKPTKVSKKLVEGECFIENGVFKVHVNFDNEGVSQFLTLEFTSDSYILKGREVVFDAQPTSPLGKGIYYRREREFKHSPGLRTQYCSVCEGCIFSGYVVRVGLDKHLAFKLHKYVRKA